MLITVRDPALGLVLGNIVVVNPEAGRHTESVLDVEEVATCPHLVGIKPGEYSCAIHDTKTYQRTGCAEYQSHFEGNPCPMGLFVIKEQD